jgi:aryl-alcohol dehydrogenase-like predicted oxidoreductase
MTTTTTQPTLTLNNGIAMPVLGLGVFQSPPEETTAAVEAAIAAGYRLIDTAASYDNEREVGEAIRRSGVDRTALFVTTKLWISDYGYDEALLGFEGCLRRASGSTMSTSSCSTSPSRPTSTRRLGRTRRSRRCSRRVVLARSASRTSASSTSRA